MRQANGTLRRGKLTDNADQEFVLLQTTRAVQLVGDSYKTSFALEALHGAARQVRENPIPYCDEHLSLLPPIGYCDEAIVREIEDGEHGLFMRLPRELDYAHYPDSTIESAGLRPFNDHDEHIEIGTSPITITYCRRNFSAVVGAEIDAETGDEVQSVERWAVLPPLEFAVFIPVVAWAARRVAGSFLDRLGVRLADAVGQKFPEWLKSTASKSKDPTRPVVVRFAFELDENRTINGYLVEPIDDVAPRVEAMMGQVEGLGSLADDDEALAEFPGLRDAAYFYADDGWHLGWWTDGATVNVTPWFLANPPDKTAILGEGPSDGEVSGMALSQGQVVPQGASQDDRED